MMNFKAIIFDLDGTLLDTLQDLALSVNIVLREHGHPDHPADAYRYFVGDGIEQMVRRAFPCDSYDQQSLPLLVDAVKNEYAGRWADNTKPYPGIAELLDVLERQRIPKAIFSNKPHEFAVLTVQTLLKDWYFNPVYGIRPGIPCKPDPYGALLIAEKMICKPEEILYLGDTSTDMQTARAAGMFPAAALWGFRPAGELKEAGAAFMAAAPGDLKEFFGGEQTEQ